MMRAHPRLRAALLLTPLLAVLLYIALNWYALVDEETRVGAKREAIENPYLAYSRLLARMGTTARFVREPHELGTLPAGGTVILGPHRLLYMTPQRLREILEWTRAGGHLVVAAEVPFVNDPLLDALGVERVEPQASAPAKPPPTRPDPAAIARAARQAAAPTTFDWPGESRALHVRIHSWFGLRDARSRPDALTVEQGGRAAILRFAEGRGTVTALSWMNFLSNALIGQEDDARFGWRLATDAGAGMPAVLFLSVHTEPLVDWMRRVAMPVVWSALLLVALWLARIIPRFGPPGPEPPPVRRSLLEHVVAAGRFLWSRDEREFLLDAGRERAWQAARGRGITRDPGALGRSLTLLASATGVSESEARTALAEPAPDAASFVRAIAALHRIESRLARGTSFPRAPERTTT